ncbi:hypothetical protein V8P78_01050 [Rhizobium sp. 6AS6]|uniref:Glycosyl hydrolase family 13 catalytic domain-containing protein n=1 Tax=Rhizobium aouanii TaxID=3118145 RepID=A0ABU8CDN2_9HYPH
MIYSIDVEEFADGNGDGIGDFVGLTEKLTYLSELGIEDPAVLVHGFEDAGSLLLLVHNLAGRRIKTEINFGGMQPGKFRDLIGEVEYAGAIQPRLELEPYAYHWFISEGNGS